MTVFYAFSSESGSIKRVKFGFIDSTLDELSYVNNESDLTVYPGEQCYTCTCTICIYLL